MSQRPPQPGDVWRHRHPCRCCNINTNRAGTRRVHHRVLVLATRCEGVVVVDLTIWAGNKRVGDPYVACRDRFGDMGAGGLGHIGRMVDGRVVAARRPDTRSRPVARLVTLAAGDNRAHGAQRTVA